MNLTAKIAWRQTKSLWRAGALNVLIFSLIIAVAAITAVGFFTQRVESALNQQGGLLLGGDLAILADHEIPAQHLERAKKLNMQSVNTFEFASMVVYGQSNQLAEIKAVTSSFPLRGNLTITRHANDPGKLVKHAPNIGEAWVEPRLANVLNLKVGDQVQVGQKSLTIGAILLNEPSRGGDMFSFAPRLMMNATDLKATQLIQLGSRVKYQLLLAANPQTIQQYQKQSQDLLVRGEKILDIKNARPEIKSSLEKAQQFLGISAMVSVILAMVSMLLSSLPYIQQTLEAFALMRCFGATKRSVIQIFALQTLMISMLSAVIGILLGFIAQLGLEKLAGHLFVETLPPVTMAPVWLAILISVSMMFAVVLPHLWRMRNVSTMNILRRDTLQANLAKHVKYLPAVLVMMTAIYWQAQAWKLALATVVALLCVCFIVTIVAHISLRLGQWLFNISTHNQTIHAIQLGFSGLKRRFSISVMQVIAFSIGLTVLILLALLRHDLIQNWQASLPVNAPNRFLINIQSDQIADIQTFFKDQHIHNASILPMVRGRLIAKNGEKIQQKNWQDERARRLAQRDFNLSFADKLQSDNKILAGRWWTTKEYGQPYISLEQGLADTLGLHVGDQLVFDVSGTPINLKVISIRKVEWDTMRANFFALTPPKVLDQFSASYLSSFHLSRASETSMNDLIKRMPNLTLIDVTALIQQLRGIMDQMSTVIEYVFIFSIMAGIAVLYAALMATQQERTTETTLMRVFGSTKHEVWLMVITEFACIGLMAACVATLMAHALAFYVSEAIFNIAFHWNWRIASLSIVTATLFIPITAWLGLRRYLNYTPKKLLQSI